MTRTRGGRLVVDALAVLLLLAPVGALLALADAQGPAGVTPPSGPAAAHTAPAPAPPAVPRLVAAPGRVEVPAIGAVSTLIRTGITDGVLDTPPVEQPEQASWWDGSPAPGEVGPAVLLGHLDGAGRRGVFADLARLAAGDEVLVDDQAGGRHRFEVYRVEQHDKDAFPTLDVYGDTAGPELRLITCGGVFDRGSGHYSDNVIVFARLAGGT